MQRERFERIDVPKPSAMRNIIAAITLVVCGVICLVLWNVCWHKANQMNGLNDNALYDALYDQRDTTGPSDGREWTDATFSNCFVVTVDDIHAEKPQLLRAQILVRNTDSNAVAVCNLPLNSRVRVEETFTTAQELFDAEGAAALLMPLTDAANIHVSHAIVGSEAIWDQLAKFRGPTILALLSSQTNDLSTISSDMTTGEFIKYSEMLQQIGFENFAQVDAPGRIETLADGSEVFWIDRQNTPQTLGIFYMPE